MLVIIECGVLNNIKFRIGQETFQNISRALKFILPLTGVFLYNSPWRCPEINYNRKKIKISQAGHNLYVSVLSSLCLLLLSRNEENRLINSPFSFHIKHGGNRALCQIILLYLSL